MEFAPGSGRKRLPSHEAPEPSEYAAYYGRYVRLVKSTDILQSLRLQAGETIAMLHRVGEDRASFRYARDKWSIGEVVGHVIDAERVFAYRALRFARNDTTPIPGFDQDEYVRNSPYAECPLADLVEEFALVRNATVCLYERLKPEAWTRKGVANENVISVRALAYIIAGHELHHRAVLAQKYLA
jgi:hypothetical protein